MIEKAAPTTEKAEHEQAAQRAEKVRPAEQKHATFKPATVSVAGEEAKREQAAAKTRREQAAAAAKERATEAEQ